jgi:hypothetical protein
MTKFLMTATLALTLGLIGQKNAYAVCNVSLAQYNKLETGMTYPKIVAALGCDGSEGSVTEMSGFKTVIYKWVSIDPYSYISLMLQNGKLISRTQTGLK